FWSSPTRLAWAQRVGLARLNETLRNPDILGCLMSSLRLAVYEFVAARSSKSHFFQLATVERTGCFYFGILIGHSIQVRSVQPEGKRNSNSGGKIRERSLQTD